MIRRSALALLLALAAPRAWAQNVGEAAAAASHAGGFNSAASAVTTVGVMPVSALQMPVSGPVANPAALSALPLAAGPAAVAQPKAAAPAALAPSAIAPALTAPPAALSPLAYNAHVPVDAAPDLSAQFKPAAEDATEPEQISEDSGRRMFDNAKAPPEIGNLFARANQATAQQRVKIQAILDTVKSRPLYVDTNILRAATNGDPQWLYFFNRARRVEITPQVSGEYSYTHTMSGREQAEALYRREKLFTKSLGPRLTEVPAPSQERRDALVDFLTSAGVSLKDSRMVAEATLNNSGGNAYLLTNDVRLAKALDNIQHSARLKQRYQAFMDTRRAADPGFPEIRFPTILVAPKP